MVSGWQTKFNVSAGPGLWSLVLGPFGPDLGPDLEPGPGPELDNFFWSRFKSSPFILVPDYLTLSNHYFIKVFTHWSLTLVKVCLDSYWLNNYIFWQSIDHKNQIESNNGRILNRYLILPSQIKMIIHLFSFCHVFVVHFTLVLLSLVSIIKSIPIYFSHSNSLKSKILT